MFPLDLCCDFSRKTGTAQVNLNRVHVIPQEMVICAKVLAAFSLFQEN